MRIYRHLYYSTVILLWIVSPCLAGADQVIYPVEKDNAWGFINATGEMVIEPQFTRTSDEMSEGLIAVEVDEKWGYINGSGAMVIPPAFDSAYAFQRGLLLLGLIHKKAGIGNMDTLIA